MWNECICVLLLCILRSGGLNNNKRQVENKSKGNKTKKKKKRENVAVNTNRGSKS